MTALFSHISNIFWLIPLFLLPLGLGNKLLRLFRLEIPNTLQAFYAYGVGLCAYSFFIFFLVVSHLLYPNYIIIFLIVSVLITYPDLKHYLLNIRPRKLVDKFLDSPLIPKMLLGAILIVFILNFLSCLAPATDYDDINYHLVVAKHYIANHAFVPMYDIAPAMMLPQFMELLNIYGLIFGNETVVRLMYFLLYLMLSVLIFFYANTIMDYKHSLWVTLIFTCTEFIAYWVQTTHVDIAMTFYALLIIIALFKWTNDKNANWLYITALFSGILFSLKFTGLILLIINVSLVIFLANKYKLSIPFSKLLIMALIFLASASPYYMLHYNNIKTVFFPYFGNGKYLNHLLNKEVIFTLKNLNLKLPGKSIFSRLLGIFLLPWKLTMDYRLFGALPIGPVFLALFPAYLILKKHLKITIVMIYSFVFITLIYLMRGEYHIERFLIPVFPLLSLSAGYILYKVNHISRLFYKMALLCLIALITLNGILITRQTSKVFPYLLGRYGKTTYLANTKAHPWGNKLEYIKLYNFINQKYGNDKKIKILLDCEMPGYYLDANYYNYSIIQTHENIIFNKSTMKKLGITHRIFYSGYWEKHNIPLAKTFRQNGISYKLLKKIETNEYDLSFYAIMY